MRNLAFCSILLLGCGGATPETNPGSVERTVSGSRLRAVFVEAADGTDHFMSWRDDQLDLACSFTRLGDEQLRCLPAREEEATINEVVYADDRCTTPLADLAPDFTWFPGCPQPRYAYAWQTGTTCTQNPSYYRVGRRLEPATVYRKEGGGCIAGPVRRYTTSSGIFSIEPVELSQFVAGALEEGPAAEGIRPVYLVTADGARAIWTFRDDAGRFDCDLHLTPAGLRCLPTDRAIVGYRFSDPQCKAPAAMALTCLEGLRRSVGFGFTSGYEEGNSVTRIFRGGDKLPVSFVGSGASCLADTTGFGAFGVGAEIPSSSFVPGAQKLVKGASGLVQPVDKAGGWSMPSPRPLQGSDNYDCLFAPTSDGVLRCLPGPLEDSPLYADARCTTLVANAGGVYSVADRTTCPARVRLFARGAEHKAAVYRKQDGNCVFLDDAPPGFPKVNHYLYDVELAPEKFVSVRLVTR
jgi:hypothetical protein